MNLLAHGGRLDAAIEKHGGSRRDWLDLSTGINPNGYKAGPLPDEIWQRLPQGSDEKALVAAARQYYAIHPGNGVIGANGTQAIIQTLPHVFATNGLKVAILSPTYGEHEHCWRLHGGKHGHEVARIDTLEDADRYDLVVVVNPNNPTGKLHQAERLAELGGLMRKRGGFLVVDEAFGDLHHDQSLARHASTNIIVLKSVGKFFGLAGLRLGFAVGPQELVTRLATLLGPWNVSGPALAVGTMALSDSQWCEENRNRIKVLAKAQFECFVRLGLKVRGNQLLFQLVEDERAGDICQQLLDYRILVRSFDDHPFWLRFGLTGNEGSLQRLENALSEILNLK